MNNRKSTKGRINQIIYSEPRKKFSHTYMTKSGQKKNKYVKNLDAKPIKMVRHYPE